jgi:hypothetical protein
MLAPLPLKVENELRRPRAPDANHHGCPLELFFLTQQTVTVEGFSSKDFCLTAATHPFLA